MSIDMLQYIAKGKFLHLANRLLAAVLGFAIAMLAQPTYAYDIDISDIPMYLGGNVPGNLSLVPSVEWPTILSVANLGAFDYTKTYTGYFDSNKCYEYSYSSTESERHFYPTNTTSTMTCSGANEWSGNFLNWAATQTIDPFRKALTGGYRVKDTSTVTWLEKARHSGQGGTGIYPNRRLPDSGDNSTLVGNVTPVNWDYLQMRIEDLGNKMRFTKTGDVNGSATAYNPSSSLSSSTVYELSVRVKVCDSSVGLESNCRPYSSGWKPEGLLQEYSDDIRYSVFGYLNDHDILRDGGVLRAQQKYIGPTLLTDIGSREDNPNKEWDPSSGVFYKNPDSADATATTNALDTTISDSGVINYLNKFGQMTSKDHKSKDPVSELYYSAIRYFKNQGNVSAYSNIDSANLSATEEYEYADGFPVITNWDDPIQYSCQPNIILGIGDVFSHRDKNLPGNSFTTDEPSVPSEVSSDSTVDVLTATRKVAALEFGSSSSGALDPEFTGRQNSAYIAGLAYDSHTKDIRGDLDGMTTISTYWVDVLEAQSLVPKDENQYWLAAKYGGFTVPEGFEPYAATTTSADITDDMWFTNGETLTSFGSRGDGTTYKRADNYFTAGEASAMVQSLKDAFYSIAAKKNSSAAAIATNSTRLDAGTYVYQARFNSGDWSGHLYAFTVNPSTGEVLADIDNGVYVWDATENIPSHNSRSIYTLNGTTGVEFLYDNLNATQQADLVSSDLVDYLRGDQSNEFKNGGLFRSRTYLLGDIINSDPWFVGKSDFGYSFLPDTEGDSYPDFIQSTTYKNRTEAIYVAANDGMLHSFDANNGDELFAYVPKGVIPNLAALANPNYSHQYFVDGSPRAGDAYIDVGLGKQWRSILLGSTGAGGRSIFALDVTTPSSFSSSNILWEFGYADADCVAGVTSCREIGYTIGQPTIVRLANGKWGAVFGNGYNSASQTARLFIVDIETGQLITVIDTERGGSASATPSSPSYDAPNGMATPIVVDIEGDHIADYVYAGDLHGNLWKFNITHDSDPSRWASSFKSGNDPAPMFTAVGPNGEVQPITSKPQVGLNPAGGYIVFFGTGKYFETGDKIIGSPADVMSFYGIYDNDAQVARSDLLQQEIFYEDSQTFTHPVTGAQYPYDIRLVTSNTSNTAEGWYIDLISPPPADLGRQGERVVSAPLIWEDRVIFTTLIPDPDPCSWGGDSWLMEVNPTTGGRTTFSVFDLNHDGSFDNQEHVTVTVDGNDITIPVNGKKSKEGIIKTPGVVRADTAIYKYTSGSSGNIEVSANSGSESSGRQSWQQLR